MFITYETQSKMRLKELSWIQFVWLIFPQKHCMREVPYFLFQLHSCLLSVSQPYSDLFSNFENEAVNYFSFGSVLVVAAERNCKCVQFNDAFFFHSLRQGNNWSDCHKAFFSRFFYGGIFFECAPPRPSRVQLYCSIYYFFSLF